MDQVGKIHNCYISNGTVKIKIQENGLIQHFADLELSFGGNIYL